ncbi:hypothetical protein [Brevundimonas lenta]|uniref:Glycerophosphoryl diester phosphodiesterase membrane domain-containing protein n=1 Tax=Brevundimonas lenta TaxID=424796 RepID=A0A7W6JFA6_9CAUL|nr:hypothetical protein [Brevundimonas lenta]MBB4083067.1 hypothetical protein [Brevundimonas lenta]
MKRFSIGASIGDAFALVRERPLSVFVWGLLILAPTYASMALMFPAMAAMMAAMPEGATGAEAEAAASQAMMAQMMQVQLASMLLNIGQLLAMAVVYTAIMRAVLRPKEKSFFALRIGMDELRVAVVGLAIMVGLYAVMIVAVLLGMAVGFALWSVDQGLMVLGAVIMILAFMVALFWGMARVSMIAPASVLRRDFAFAEGWKLAAGKSWPLFGMMILIGLIILAIELVVVLIGVGVFTGVAASADWSWIHSGDDALPEVASWMAANWYWFAIAGVVVSLFYGIVLTLSIAPFASACRQLADSSAPKPDPEPVPVHDEVGSPA